MKDSFLALQSYDAYNSRSPERSPPPRSRRPMKYTRLVPGAVLAVLVTAACDTSELVNPEAAGSPTPSLSAAPQAQIRTQDDEHARVARAEVPGFAGFYLEEDGTPVVRLVDLSQRGAAQRYLAQELTRAHGRANAPTEPVFLSAAYDFAQLKGWAEQVETLLARSDVFLVDVDEVNNRVHVGVANNTAAGVVRPEAVRQRRDRHLPAHPGVGERDRRRDSRPRAVRLRQRRGLVPPGRRGLH